MGIFCKGSQTVGRQETRLSRLDNDDNKFSTQEHNRKIYEGNLVKNRIKGKSYFIPRLTIEVTALWCYQKRKIKAATSIYFRIGKSFVTEIISSGIFPK